jgi:hypothetical protein
LGEVLKCSDHEWCKSLLATEMLARAAKNLIRTKWRQLRIPDDEVYKQVVVDFLYSTLEQEDNPDEKEAGDNSGGMIANSELVDEVRMVFNFEWEGGIDATVLPLPLYKRVLRLVGVDGGKKKAKLRRKKEKPSSRRIAEDAHEKEKHNETNGSGRGKDSESKSKRKKKLLKQNDRDEVRRKKKRPQDRSRQFGIIRKKLKTLSEDMRMRPRIKYIHR